MALLTRYGHHQLSFLLQLDHEAKKLVSQISEGVGELATNNEFDLLCKLVLNDPK